MKIELFKDAGGCWRWRIVGGNREILATSEAYAKKANADRTAKRIAHLALAAAEIPIVDVG